MTSANNNWWKTATFMEASSGNANATVNDTTSQKWEGFGGAFNELGWTVLTTKALQDQAVQLLFGTDGAHFSWGRIPMGASDYATKRYTLDDPSEADPTGANTSGAGRPAVDTSMSKFTIMNGHDDKNLIPYIKAALAVNPNLKFWASPWTPPISMKSGLKTDTAKRPSYFDGGNMVNNDANLTAYALYYTKFVQAYKDQGINIEIVSPQNEPGYEQNYPSCLWDKTTYTAWIGKYLGPAMKALNVKVMLGTMSNNGDTVAGMARKDTDLAAAVMGDSTAMSFISVAGVQWGALEAVNNGTKFGSIPIWATEHKCGNYPWNPSGYPAYNSSKAPNDLAYGVESWGYLRDAINKGHVTSYSAWNMVLDSSGLGNDTTRDWKQDALLVASGGSITQTPAYYVFRHLAQYTSPGGNVLTTSGNDVVGFKNSDGSYVAVVYNSGAANSNYIVSVGGKKIQFAMPQAGWATVMVKP